MPMAAGVSKVDLSEVDFLAVAGARALLAAAELLHERGEPMIVIDPHVVTVSVVRRRPDPATRTHTVALFLAMSIPAHRR